MNTTFTDRFNLQQRQQEEVSKKWHYTISPLYSQNSKPSSSAQKQINVNRQFRPLIIDDSKPIVSAQHEELIKEIAEIEHLKKMRKRAEQKSDAEFNVIKLMNERVKQYNYLVDHKHIKEKNSEDTKRVLKLKPKSEAELIVDQIKAKNKELLNAEDIEKQFELNKTIAALYRKYKDKMFEEGKSEREDRKLRATVMPASGRKDGFKENPRTRNYSECLSKLKIKLEEEQSSEANDESSKLLSEPVNIEEPYMTKQEIKMNNELQNFTENRKEMLKMYKFKITKLKSNGHERKLSTKRKSILPNSETKIDRLSHLFQSVDRDKLQEPDRNEISELKKKRQTQLHYFTSFLEKRNRKFKKPWGNKILIEFKSMPLAKQMLEGTFSSPQKTVSNSFTASRKTKLSSSLRLGENVSEEDRMIFQSMEKEKNDPQLYETMCKNQKVNLFLKAKKKSKQ